MLSIYLMFGEIFSLKAIGFGNVPEKSPAISLGFLSAQ